MVVFLGLSLALWLFGRNAGLPIPARLWGIGLLYVAILLAHVILTDSHPLPAAIGGSTAEWVSLGVLGALAIAYSRGLRALRARVRPENQPQEHKADAGRELERNARHIVLREIGGPGQKRLKGARVLVVGAGGLGAPALQYLGAAGIGTLGIIDDDVVENSNLQRQIIHTDDRIGMPKVFSAQAALSAQNPYVTIRPYHRRLTADIADDLFRDYDLVLDGTDDVATRYLVNETAVRLGVPLVSAAITQWEGQISLFHPAQDAPCYTCVFPDPPAAGLAPSCAEGGVLGPLPGVMGAMMAVEAIKHLAQTGQTLAGRMMIYDALYAETRTIRVARRPDCPVCGSTS